MMIAIGALMLSGCGASKSYVDQQLAQTKSDLQSEINKTKSQATMNADEIKQLKQTTAKLQEDTEMALNMAKGYENYQVIWEGVVNFDFDSYQLTQIAKDNLEALGQKMVDNPRSILEVAGHTDKTGPQRYNFMLGQMRSGAVKKYLADQFGVGLYRMFEVSHGETKPVAMPDEKNANSKNRRVVLKLWGEM